MEILITGGGLAMLAAAVNALFKDWRESRKAKRDAQAEERLAEVAEKKSLQDRADKYQGKVESLLHDAVAAQRELVAQMSERIKMDEAQNTVLNAATAALTENTKVLARLEPLLTKLVELKG
jgi:pyruvate-formate lyase